MLRIHRIFTCVLIVVSLLIAGCGAFGGSNGDAEDELPTLAAPVNDADATPEATPDDSDTTPEVSSDSENATPEAVSNGTSETPEAAPNESNVTPEVTAEVLSIEEQYDVSVSYGLEADSAPDTDQDPPEGSRWYVVAATVSNTGGATIELTANEVALIDAEGERYAPLAEDPSLSPPLLGTFAEGESVLGLARFAIPVEATPTTLEVCLDNACNEVIQDDIP